jgi:hypothetical protein
MNTIVMSACSPACPCFPAFHFTGGHGLAEIKHGPLVPVNEPDLRTMLNPHRCRVDGVLQNWRTIKPRIPPCAR